MIIFRNQGEMDMRAVTTFGLSAKSGSNPIGRFGTGLKYAIAVVLRNGGSIKVMSGADEYGFETRAETFRDAEKQFVYMSRNGEAAAPLGFTTELGRDWLDWQAFREFYSNCKDEAGELTHRESGTVEASEGVTLIAVEHRPFEAIFYSLEQYFIGDGEEPLWENDELAVYPGRSKHVFYQGICVHELKEPAAFRYNIKRYLDLTEDRTAKYSWQVVSRIVGNLPLCNSEAVCKEVLAPSSKVEREFDYTDDFHGTPSEAFAGAVVASRGDCPVSAVQLVRMTLPEGADEMNVAGPATKGNKELSNAVSLAVNAGLDKSGITFVLGIGLPVIGDYTVREKNLILAEGILEDQDKMNMAVVQGIAEIQSKHPRHYLAQLLIDATKAAA
jgi:hypothetical protein